MYKLKIIVKAITQGLLNFLPWKQINQWKFRPIIWYKYFESTVLSAAEPYFLNQDRK